MPLGTEEKDFQGRVFMHSETPDWKAFEARIQRLEQRIDALLNGLNRVSKNGYDYDMVQDRHVKLLGRGQDDLFERVKRLELNLFPGLAADMARVYDLIGDGDDQADNPLDRRKP
jgi:hypothetical protein